MTDWRMYQLEQLRDEVRDDGLHIVGSPGDYGMLWRRLDTHLSECNAILNDIVTGSRSGVLDDALACLEHAAGEISDLGRRLERFMEANIEDARAGVLDD